MFKQTSKPIHFGAIHIFSILWFLLISFFFFRNVNPLTVLYRHVPDIPVELVSLARLASSLPELVFLIFLALAFFGAGSLILIPFRQDIDGFQRLNLSFGLGMGLFSLLTLFLGLAGGYSRYGALAVMALVLVFAVIGGISAVNIFRAAPRLKPDRLRLAYTIIFSVIVLFLLSRALVPTFFYDSITYHLGVPNYYILEGGIKYIPSDSYSNFPFMAEMIYTLGMLLYGLKLAQLCSIMFFAACVFLIYDFTRVFVKDVNPAIPSILFLLTPAFMENAVLYTNDLYLTYYTLLVVYCFFLYEKENKDGSIVLMGIFTGICLGSKYIALVSILVPAFLGTLYLGFKYRDNGISIIKAAGLFLLPAILVYLPWLAKNYIYTGNPFYPAFYSIFGGRDMTAGLYSVYQENHPSKSQALMGLVTHPFTLFLSRPLDTIIKYHAAPYFSQLLLLLTPLVFFVKNRPYAVKILMTFVLILYIFWTAAFPLARYLYPAIAVLTVVAGYSLTRLLENAPGTFVAATSAIVAFYISYGLCLGFYQVNSWTNAPVNVTDDAYLMRKSQPDCNAKLSSYPIYRYINDKTPESSRVLIIGDAQHLYIKRRHLYTYLSASPPEEVFIKNAGSTRTIYESLRNAGITHIVYNPLELSRLQGSGYIAYPPQDNKSINDFLSTDYVRMIVRDGKPENPVFLFNLK